MGYHFPNLLTNPTINGTIATTGLTLPAVTLGGDITLGTNKLIATDVLLKRGEADWWYIRNNVDNAWSGLKVKDIYIQNGELVMETAGTIRTWNGDNATLSMKARANGVGVVEIACFQSAADPYFQATLPMVLNPSAAPGTPVTGHFYYDSTANKLKFYNGTAWETVTSA